MSPSSRLSVAVATIAFEIHLNPLKARLAQLETFDVTDDINADYPSLVEQLERISKQATSPVLDHVDQRITEMTRNLLERDRYANRTTAAFQFF